MQLNDQKLEKFTYDVFISYSSKDKPAVRELARRLKAYGVRVWFDEWEIKPGDMIGLKIEQGLEQSRTLVLVMSANAFSSDWVALERHTAMFRDPTNARRRFIPLRLDDTEIKDTLKQFAYVDWRQKSDEYYQKLLTACQVTEGLSTKPPFQKIDKAKEASVLAGHKDYVYAIAITPDKKKVVLGSTDKTLKVWDLEFGQCLATFEGHTEGVLGVAITPDGKKVVSGSSDKTLKVWDLEFGQCLATFEGHTEGVLGVAITPDGKKVVSSSRDKTLKVWDLESGQCLTTLEGHTDSIGIWGVAVTPNGRKIISGSRDASIKVWDLGTGKCIRTFEGHKVNVNGVTVTPDGTKIVSGSADKTLKVWDLEFGQCLASFEGHTDYIYEVAVTPDGKRVVSGSNDNTLKVWDLESGECLDTFEGHTKAVLGFAVTPDGKKVVSGSSDYTVRIWELPEYGARMEPSASTRYTNAKVALVGETGVGKTGLALRLCENRWETTESTQGMLVSQLKLPQGESRSDIEREVWLWDFAGQPDYRLIHQLYMDETALGILVFDPQDDNPFEDLGHWEKALLAAAKYPASQIARGSAV